MRGGESPDPRGYFGRFGGCFVPETMVAPVRELETAYREARADAGFQRELTYYLMEYAGRPTPLTAARRFSEHVGRGCRIYLKREDLLHTGTHKLNNALGQVLLARRMGKTRVVTATGAGLHGVATATAAALLGVECTVYMGDLDRARQAVHLEQIQMLGAQVRRVERDGGRWKEAVGEATGEWVRHASDTVLVLGSALGAHPYPMMVRDFQSVIGREAREQILDAEDRLPDRAVACVGGGSGSLGLFSGFLEDESVALVGVEGGGEGIATGRHAARFVDGEPGVFQGSRTMVLQDAAGNIRRAHSIAADLECPAVAPEHAHLHDEGRVLHAHVENRRAVEAFLVLARTEGILPALEPSHALAWLIETDWLKEGEIIVVNLCGSGDKDLETVADLRRLGDAGPRP
jgi:tryptophan synthase beta chain